MSEPTVTISLEKYQQMQAMIESLQQVSPSARQIARQLDLASFSDDCPFCVQAIETMRDLRRDIAERDKSVDEWRSKYFELDKRNGNGHFRYAVAAAALLEWLDGLRGKNRRIVRANFSNAEIYLEFGEADLEEERRRDEANFLGLHDPNLVTVRRAIEKARDEWEERNAQAVPA